MHLRYVFKFPFIAAVMCAAASVSLGACGGADPVDGDVAAAGEAQELTAESAEALTCPASLPTIDLRKSLIVTKETDPGVFTEFTLSFVLQKLIDSVGSDQQPLNLYQRWWDTQNDDSHSFFGDPDSTHCDDVLDSNGGGLLNGFPYTCPRNEGVLAGSNPFDPNGPHFMEPVALVNRFDLAPVDGSHCGEYRIIYAKKSSSPIDRNFIIFEAQLPNPNPECGIAACLPVAEFWANLSDPNMTSTQRRDALEGFYFNGLPGFAPVIQASNFMASTGQIRTNQFMRTARPALDPQPWTLREFKLDLGTDFLDNSIRLFFEPVTVKENPSASLFSASFDPNDPRGAAFRSGFLDALDGLVPVGDDENDISLRTLPNQDLFNTGESVVDSSSDYRQHLQGNTAFIADIDAALAPIIQSRGLLPGMVTADNAADRATTQSCAGCHELSSVDNEDLGGLHVWPEHFPTTAPGTFVHVNEEGEISAPLQWTFLPHRAQVLTSFIEEKSCETACPSTAASADVTEASADVLLDSAEQVPTLGGATTH
ncbi:uncharacterized protein SOCE26_106630 [Sorangium cellulosum]|uniref:Cytochrome c domain-containing protein n=1 Tax=Sorangium cellulosum TaxID=56 RepID=A0A2L0FBY8_SORCE|nr:hypothetical protein [Sorangium cellulosum]AUX49118.1 uncharacterized protein SOCE26_106630 [Sorangium cellulosum]